MSDSSSEQLVLSAPQIDAVVGLSRAFLSAARVWTMYSPDHPACLTAIGRLDSAVLVAGEAGVAASLNVLPASLLAGGIPVPDHQEAVAEMAAALHRHGVIEIGFDAPVPHEALRLLLTLLAQPPGSFDDKGGVGEAWMRSGHPAIRIQAVDYGKVLEDRDPQSAAPRRDDIWRSIVSALSSGRRTLDEREQQRLLEIAEDPAQLTALAEVLMADKCTADGSPMVMTQAATVLLTFRQLASIAAVAAPDRAEAVRRNISEVLLRIDPRITLQMVVLEGQAVAPGPALSALLGEDAIARLLATALTIEGEASTRVAQVFELLVPEADRRPGVLEQVRTAAESCYHGSEPFGAFFNRIQELLLAYNDQPYVSGEYRAVLARAGGNGNGNGETSPELHAWLSTVTEDRLRQTSIVLLGDLLRLEAETPRAPAVLGQLAALAEDLLVAGVYEDALRVLDAIDEGTAREDLAARAAETRARIAGSAGMRDAIAMMGDLRPGDWASLAECLRRTGPSCLAALRAPLLAVTDSAATERAGEVFVSIGEAAVEPLVGMLGGCPPAIARRIATLLGRIGSVSAVPALQGLLRSTDARVVQCAVRALAGIDDRGAARALQVAMRAADGEAREMIVDALVEASDRRVVPMLVRVLQDSRPLGADHQVVLQALDALGRLGDARAVPAVSAVLFLRGWFLRNWLSRRRLRALKLAAAGVLVRMDDVAAVQALGRAREAGDRLLRRVAREVQAPPVEGAA